MQQYRTNDVIALMARIDDAAAYELLPILADALQDAGYANEEVLAWLRKDTPEEDAVAYRQVVAGVVTVAQVEDAVAYLADFGQEFRTYDYEDHGDDLSEEERDDDWYDAHRVYNDDGLSFEEVMTMCRNFVETDETEGFGHETNDIEVTDMWKHYEVLTGTRPPKETYTGEATDEYDPQPFRCAC